MCTNMRDHFASKVGKKETHLDQVLGQPSRGRVNDSDAVPVLFQELCWVIGIQQSAKET